MSRAPDFAGDIRETVARAIYAKRPDCWNKPWPVETAVQRRAYPHHPIAAVDLSYIYADAAIEALRPMVRTADFDSANLGSSPRAPTNHLTD